MQIGSRRDPAPWCVTAMTAVTAISIYSDLGVICVIAVTVYQLDEPAFAGAFGAIHDAHWLQHVAGELAEVFGNHV